MQDSLYKDLREYKEWEGDSGTQRKANYLLFPMSYAEQVIVFWNKKQICLKSGFRMHRTFNHYAD